MVKTRFVALIIFVVCAFLLLNYLHFVRATTTSYYVCEVCNETTFIFNPERDESNEQQRIYYIQSDNLNNIYLSSINNITLIGHQSHGISYVSITCELICGIKDQPCCYNVSNNRYECKYDYLYCTNQSENGICRVDENPPTINITTDPVEANGENGCSGYINQTVDVYIQCNDPECGNDPSCCEEYRYRLYLNQPSNCSKNYNAYYPSSTNHLTVSRHSYICAAGKDRAGNNNTMEKPVEICVNTQNPFQPFLYYYPNEVGAESVVLIWRQQPLNSPNFNRSELHFSETQNFNITPLTLYTTFDTEPNETTNYVKRIEVTGLNRSTTYYFKLVVFDNSYPIRLNSTSNEVRVTTKACDPNEITPCFKNPRNGKIYYGSDVEKVIKGVCKPGNATCVNGRWSYYCENQTGPFPTETCNGLDDDCDGYIDNKYYNNPTYNLSRICYAPGICGVGEIYCVNGKWQNETTECSSLSRKHNETCNGLDDDCDGIRDNIDGKNSVEETRCGCYGEGSRNIETCNGIDDNCNERIDDVSPNPSTCACYNGTHKPGELSEICNGIDDDCNGIVDDPWISILGSGWPIRKNPCGQGTPCRGGYWECASNQSGVVCSTIGGSQNKARNEECNGIDDNCDGTIDEGCECTPPGSYRECGSDVGECRKGMQRCENGIWGNCSGGVSPKIEVCDARDNDCDGVVDNVDNETSINTTRCACYNGNYPLYETCNGIDDNCDGIIDDVSPNPSTCACYKGTHKPGELSEICNGIDDDCDGAIDEDWPSLGKPCGEGICAGGKIVCSTSDNSTVCSTMSNTGVNATDKRKAEVCNGLDDDCDGVIDNLDGKNSVEETKCRCTLYGKVNQTAEVCNHIDDDCDGAIDEDLFCVCYTGEKKPCGSAIGECELGETECVDGVWGVCKGGKGPSQEVCNMKDDDCDGIVDDVNDGYSIEETQCGCFNNVLPTIESCDGIDNDCNGKIDDDIDCRCTERQKLPCGSNVGVCTPGVKECIDGKWGECKGGVLPSPEICNGLDDDCNGIVDDVSGGSSISSTKCGCYNNFAKPGTQKEIANGIDDDCDGMIDEGFIAEEEPGYCYNGMKDGDEDGVDCGGSCKKRCPPKPLPFNMWLIIFAIVAAIIIIFGIVIGSFYKSGKKTLSERIKHTASSISPYKKIVYVIFVFGLLFGIFINVLMYTVESTNGGGIKFDRTWSCSNGKLSPCSSTPTLNPPPCAVQPYLLMNNNQYTLSFSPPQVGNYTCNITVKVNHFDFTNSQFEHQEYTEVYLKNERINVKIGQTSDIYCPPGQYIQDGDGNQETWYIDFYLCKNEDNKYCTRGRYGYETKLSTNAYLSTCCQECAGADSNGKCKCNECGRADCLPSDSQYLCEKLFCLHTAHVLWYPEPDCNNGGVWFKKDCVKKICSYFDLGEQINSDVNCCKWINIDGGSEEEHVKGCVLSIKNRPGGRTLFDPDSGEAISDCEGTSGGSCQKTKNCGESCTIIDNCDPCKEGRCISVNNVWRCFNCCGDGVCQNNEDYNNCPEDCDEPEPEPKPEP
jgi:hypothetical protein